MRPLDPRTNAYFDELRRRSKDFRLTHAHQVIGVEIAELLHDSKHTALYIKLAKEYPRDMLITLAKSVTIRNDIKQPGAYFMRLVSETLPKSTTTKRRVATKRAARSEPNL